jgi:hypothetical protein
VLGEVPLQQYVVFVKLLLLPREDHTATGTSVSVTTYFCIATAYDDWFTVLVQASLAEERGRADYAVSRAGRLEDDIAHAALVQVQGCCEAILCLLLLPPLQLLYCAAS